MLMIRWLARRIAPPRLRFQISVARELRSGEPELHLLPILIDPNKAFLDVGANIGFYSYIAERYARRVFAAEPHPELIARLQQNLRSTTTILPYALSDRSGRHALYVPIRDRRAVLPRSSLNEDAEPGMARNSIEVECRSIDNLALGDVGMIKIDVEGHELQTLRGASDTLVRQRPVLLVEIEERHHPGGSPQIFDFLRAFGYRGVFLHRGRVRQLDEFDPSQLQRTEHAKSVAGGRHPDYVNNFIFVDRADSKRLDRVAKFSDLSRS